MRGRTREMRLSSEVKPGSREASNTHSHLDVDVIILTLEKWREQCSLEVRKGQDREDKGQWTNKSKI
jgi:hypothetical protein